MRRNRCCCRCLTIALFACAAATLIPTANARADDSADPLNALMMGATGMPTPSEFWQDTIVTDYIDPATNADYTPVTVATPASYASTSAPIGLADLQAAMAAQQLNYPGDPYLVEGYSQSAQIVVAEKIELMEAGQHPDVTFLMLGDPYRPYRTVLTWYCWRAAELRAGAAASAVTT